VLLKKHLEGKINMNFKIIATKAFSALKATILYTLICWVMTIVGGLTFHWLGGEIAREYHVQPPSYNACVDAVLLIGLVAWLLWIVALLVNEK
jgi:hypothetical protein